jgi:hypothetical protein
MPRVRLTEQMIQAAKRPGELWDADVPGLFLRVQPRKKTWGLRYVFGEKGEGGSWAKRRDHLGVYPGLGLLGITDDVVSRVLSHSVADGGAAVTRRHYNLAQQVGPTRAALQLLSDHLDGIIAEKPARKHGSEADVSGRRLTRRRIA